MQIGTTSLHAAYSREYRGRSPVASVESNLQSDSATSSALDFTGMTRQVLREKVNSLILSGRMSLEDSSGLVGMMGPAATTYAGTDTTMPDNGGERIDALAVLRAGIEGAKSRNDDKNAAMLSRTLSALERLQGSLSAVDLQI